MKTTQRSLFLPLPLLILAVLALASLFTSCRKKQVNTSFYYWKTVYKDTPAESDWLRHFKTRKLYMRIMDVAIVDGDPRPVPVSPILFQSKIADSIELIPVVFIVNDVLRNTGKPQLDELAKKIVGFVNGKVEQAGKSSYNELQIDCDWTATTRDNYFYLLKQIRSANGLKAKTLSATLRLHQIKNQKVSGIPPVNRVMLMCYNMGNLRLYGKQNSILDINELKKYANENIGDYHLPIDIGLPLFSWAVAFREKNYIGITKRINKDTLDNKNQFIFKGNNIYQTLTDLPQYGLNRDDEIRWETINANDLQAVAKYLSPLLKTDTVNIIYFHLDAAALKAYTYETLEKTNHMFR
ncbi:hypothetical protein AAFN85_00845 [Mucilaginibacter sp. CAU 1740]|uniref:hypothetical protein n=1 Tax=Mucilaginibacter sp. CAU 1740 TaxID=3140365 RepID=UPI00325B50C5